MDKSFRAGRRAALLTSTGFIAVSGAAFAAPAAHAKSFSLSVGTSVTKGKASASGSVTFPTAKKVVVRGKVRDICPKDGYGAYIEFKVNFVGGGYGTNVRKDTTGCGDGAVSYSFTKRFARKVRSVGVTLIEIDADSGAVGDAARKLITR